MKTLGSMVSESDFIVFFGGAGVSTESGIPDFRSADGLYRQAGKYPPEQILSHSFFLSLTEDFYDFYRTKILTGLDGVRPNPAHLTLARWEREGKLRAVVTQNIDGLHQAAGSETVLELHGSVYRNYCTACKKSYGLPVILESAGVPRCDCGGVIRPDVTLYEESLDEGVLRRAVEAMVSADMLIIGGTSLSVYPAAGLAESYRGHKLVLINRDPTPLDAYADLLIRGSIGEVLGEL